MPGADGADHLDDLPALLSRARVAADRGGAPAAVDLLAAAAARWPDHPAPHVLDARLRRRDLDLAGAVRAQRRAIERGASPAALDELAPLPTLAAAWAGPTTAAQLAALPQAIADELPAIAAAPATPDRWCVIVGALHTGGATTLVLRLIDLLLEADLEVTMLPSHLEGHGAADRVTALRARGVTVSSWASDPELTPGLLDELSRWGDPRPLGDQLRQLAPARIQITGSALMLAVAGTVALHATTAQVGLRVGMEAPTERDEPEVQALAARHDAVRAVLREVVAAPRAQFQATSARCLDGHRRWLGDIPSARLVPTIVDSGLVRARAATPVDAPWPEAALVVGAVMRLSPEKRPGLWAAACTLVAAARPDVHFCLVGDGDASLLGDAPASIAGRWHHLGYQLRPEPWMAAMAVIVSTSATEAMPTTVLEAACLGVPAVVSDVGGSSEAILEGECGALVTDVDDPAAYAAAIIELLDDPARRSTLGAVARASVEQRFSARVVAPLIFAER